MPRTEHAFVGRTAELEQLTKALIRPGGSGTGGVVVQAVHGLGGVGKSALAAYWARTHASEHEVAWWINADTQAALDAGLASLMVAVQPELAGRPLETLTAQAMAWLASHTRWLLVLDNVTAPAHIAPLLDRAQTGRVLVTSRLAEGWHRLDVTVVRLDALPEQDAISLLTAIAVQDRDDADLTSAAELARALGYLPLAIEQAAAYLHQTHLSPAAYLTLLHQSPAVMYDQTARGNDADRSIARIWRITLDTLADTPLAGRLLRILAWWAPEAVPRTLLDPIADPAELAGALGSLAAYDMISLTQDAITVHRLVQAVARTPDPGDPHRQASEVTASRDKATWLLADALPGGHQDPADWPPWRALLPHIDALADHAPADTDTLTTAYLLDQAGLFLNEQGAAGHALSCQKRAFTVKSRVLGDDHPSTLAGGVNLAASYQTAGYGPAATVMLIHTLAICERVLRTDHPITLSCRNGLANAHLITGVPGLPIGLMAAIRLYEENLAERARLLGNEHPATLIAQSNLALAYKEAGDPQRAIPFFEQTLAGFIRALGDEDPRTLTCRLNLAQAYGAAGDQQREIMMLEDALPTCIQVLGADHPSTLVCRGSLAAAYYATHNRRQAVELAEQVLADCVRALGTDHPITETTRGNYEAMK